MSLTKSQIKQAQKALTVKLEEQYTQAEIDTIQWFVDYENPDGLFYRWEFVFPKDGKKRYFLYVFSTKSVVIRRVD